MYREEEPREEGELLPGLDSVPAVARLAAAAWFRGATWGLGATLGAAARLGDAAGSVIGLAEEVAEEVVDDAVEAVRTSRERPRETEVDRAKSLRERGAELLDRAADVSDGRDPIPRGSPGSSTSSHPTRPASSSC